MRRLLFLAPLLFLLRPALAAPEQPNVLLILTDDQTLESMRVMDRTLARLAAEGTTFSNSIVSYSLCCPSRATELTGQYAHNHKVMGNKPPNGGYGRLDGSNTLQKLPLVLFDVEATVVDKSGSRFQIVHPLQYDRELVAKEGVNFVPA